MEPAKFIEQIYDLAKQNLEKDGYLRAMAFVGAGDKMVICDVHEMLRSNDSKDMLGAGLKRLIKETGASHLLFLSESWTLSQDDTEEYMKNMEKYNFSLDNHPRKKECVHFTFEDAKGATLGMAMILRSGEKPYLGNLRIMEKPTKSEGRFTNFFNRKDD